MLISQAITIFMDYQKMNSGKKYGQKFGLFLNKFKAHFGDYNIQTITPEHILQFLIHEIEGQKPATKCFKYTLLKNLFNFLKDSADSSLANPCETAILRKSFRLPKGRQWTILEKDVVDEIIFRTDNLRNRIMLELMARGGMRIGEVLNFTVRDVEDCKLYLTSPKSGRENEVVFIPKKVASRLRDYIRSKNIAPDEKIFPLGYSGARLIVKKAGRMIGVELAPHDLRRHAATYASRSGAPIEIVSKIILRHANLSTTQRYLGKVSDTEASRWIENIFS